jgi:intracellular multiplication protein IcmB
VTGLQEVAATGSATSNRRADMMYLLRRHILGRNFFLRPDCVHHVPEAVRRHHSKRFREAYEAVKQLDYDVASYAGSAPRVSSTRARDASIRPSSASRASASPPWATR